MGRLISISFILFLLLAPNALAGFSSYDSPYSGDNIVASIQIKNKGIYNLVVSIQFLNEPYETKIYESDEKETKERV